MDMLIVPSDVTWSCQWLLGFDFGVGGKVGHGLWLLNNQDLEIN